MSYAFKKIGATNMLETAPDNANVVCEVDGEVNRVPATSIGGGGIKVAIIKDTGSGLSCDNMTYEEAVEYLTNGVPFLIFVFTGAEYRIAVVTRRFEEIIRFYVVNYMTGKPATFEWTPSGISVEAPIG